MKILIIGNPIASGGDAGKRISALKDALEKKGHSAEAYLTKFAGDGKERVSKVEDDVDRIVIVGGDGTVNEVINGIPEGFKTPLLQLPTGNANLLARDLKLPKTINKVVSLLENGTVIMADVAQMNGTRFIMVAGVGLDARVTEALKRKRTGRVNNFSYLGPILEALGQHSKSEFCVEVDGAAPVKGAAVLVCNIRNYAGICDIAYDADIASRVLDIVVLPKDNLFSFLKYLLFARFSKITRLKNIKYLKGKKIKITSDIQIPIELDGDFNDRHAEVTIELLQEQVPLIVPV